MLQLAWISLELAWIGLGLACLRLARGNGNVNTIQLKSLQSADFILLWPICILAGFVLPEAVFQAT